MTLNLASPALTGRTRVFPDITARNAATPDFVGQMGYQTDTGYYYFANLATPGSWAKDFKMAQPTTISGLMSASGYEMTASNYYGFFNGSHLVEGSGSLKTITLPSATGTLVTLAGADARARLGCSGQKA